MTAPTHSSQPSRRRRVWLWGGASLAVVGVSIAAVIANATEHEHSPEVHKPPKLELIEKGEELPPGLKLADGSHFDLSEHLEMNPGDLDSMEWLNHLHFAFFGDPNFGSVATSPSGDVYTVTWFGEITQELQALLDEAPQGVEVVIHPATFPPGELQQLVTQAMGREFLPGIVIAMGGVENDASGIFFGLTEEPQDMTLDQVARALSEKLTRPDVPIRVEITGAVMPVSGGA